MVQTVEKCGWWWPFKNAVIITDRPCELHRDPENRLHSETGPALLYRDGWGIHAFHGVRVDAWIVEHPELITITNIGAENNSEIRRVMIERYGVDRYILDSGTLPVHADEFGTLYKREVPGDEPIVLCHVLNSTPEPDGKLTRSQAMKTFAPTKKLISKHPKDSKFKTYFLRVDPLLRPMLENNQFGKPQKLTALNAVASTFGMTGEEYRPLIES